MFCEAILFDLDDTLHDRNKSLLKFIELFRKRFSFAMDRDSNLLLKDVFYETDCRGYKSRNEMFKELQEKLFGESRIEIQECIDFWNDEFPKCAKPTANLYTTLDFLCEKNICLGIVTNGDIHFQNTKIEKLNLKRYMKTIIISEEVGFRKPDAEIFHLALCELGLSNNAVLFVGDNPSTDIKGAINAGLKSVWINFSEHWNQENYKPDFIINNISELKNIADWM